MVLCNIGHGGSKVSKYLANNVVETFIKQLSNCISSVNCEQVPNDDSIHTFFLSILSDTLRKLEEDVITVCKTQNWRSGSTALIILVVNNAHMYIGHVGDSVAVMGEGLIVSKLNDSHSPSREDERTRICNAGGSVLKYDGVWRVHPGQVITRLQITAQLT